jgi:hypothetical protein
MTTICRTGLTCGGATSVDRSYIYFPQEVVHQCRGTLYRDLSGCKSVVVMSGVER